MADPRDEPLYERGLEASISFSRDKLERSLTALDFSDELFESFAQIKAAMNTNDPALVGRVVIAVRDAYLDRVSCQIENAAHTPVYAEEAAQRELDASLADVLRMSIAANDRRVSA